MAVRDRLHRAMVLCRHTATMQTRKLTSNRCSFLAHCLRPIRDLQYLSQVVVHMEGGDDRLSSASLCGQSTQIGHVLLSVTVQMRQ